MVKRHGAKGKKSEVSRRDFVRTGGAVLAGGAALGGAAIPAGAETMPGRGGRREALFPNPQGQDAKIQAFRTLGRTGFQVSDVGMGSVPLRETSVVRYAYDKGVNYFDTAESYGNGAAERAIGEAMQHMERDKIFIASKARAGDGDDAEAMIQKVRQSLERLQTDYVDSYSMHGVSSVEALNHPGFHEAMDLLKAEGRVRFRGVSCHGPGRGVDQTAGDILVAAAEDGRFDMMLLVYNFLNHEEGDRVLAACKANNVGTTAMKTSPGSISYEPVDPENLSETQEGYIQRFVGRGQTREAAMQRLMAQAERQKELVENTRPFADQYGVQTAEQLRVGSIHWVLQNPDMHTACVAFTDFGLVDRVIPISGTVLTAPEQEMLHQIKLALDNQYCRHACVECVDACPVQMPVSTIMRYAYYYEGQGLEKHAMSLYAGLDGTGASACMDCAGHCAGACRYGIDIQPSLLQVHNLLTLA
jgi:aryl-alcohol dehydrogenase-like predicted oxidoreductase